MKTVTLINQKGGCGKTVIALNLSSALNKKGYRILLLDLDPQAHASFTLSKNYEPSTIELLEGVAEKRQLNWQDFCREIENKFFLIPARIGLATLEQKLSSHPDKLELVLNFLKGVSNCFDYCLIDCPPNLGLLTLNGLMACDYAIIPLNVCNFSLHGLELLKEIMLMLREFKGKSPAPFYLLNMVDRRSNFSKDFMACLKIRLGSLLLQTHIRNNVYLREAISLGKTIFNYKIKSRGAEDFTNLANEIEGISSKGNWTSLFLKTKGLSEVYVVGDFNNWQKQEKYKLARVGDDLWVINLPLEKGKYRYKFVEKDSWFNDPHNKLTENDPFGGKNSLLFVE